MGTTVMTAMALWLLAADAAPTFHNPLLAKAVQQLRTFHEAEALATLEKARVWPENTDQDLAQVELYAGLAHGELAHAAEALASFRVARRLEPSLTLPPGTSPRIQGWWQDAAPRTPPTPAPVPPPAPAVDAPVVEKPAPVLTPAPVEPQVAVVAEPPAPPRWGRVAALATLGAAAAVLVAAVAQGALAQGNAAQAQAAPTVSEARALESTAQAQARGANVTYGVAGGLGAVGLGLLVLAPGGLLSD